MRPLRVWHQTARLITCAYEDHAFVFREDDYFDMTKAAKSFGKRLDNFLANTETQEYIQELNGALVPDIPVIKIQRGSGLLPSVGTWGHPKLAVFFANVCLQKPSTPSP